MQDNQKPVSSQGEGAQKPTLSWSQPQSKPHNEPKAPALQNSNSKLALLFAIGLVVGWLVTWSWFDLRGHSGAAPLSGADATSTDESARTALGTGDASGNDHDAGMSDASAAAQADDTISVPSEQQAGMTVDVTSVSAQGSVWAVVYEYNDDTLGRALGAARFWPGYQSGQIDLLRSTLPNLHYAVALTADTPDHAFDIHANTPIVDAHGNRIVAEFTAK